MASMRQKIGVIGVGAVGSASLLSTVLRGVAREIVVVNREPKRARGVVADVQYGAALSPAVDIRAGDYPDLDGATLVMIAAGTNEKAGGATDRADPNGRLRLSRRTPASTSRFCRGLRRPPLTQSSSC